MICFRVGSVDASHFAKEFYPVFNETDIINLPKFSMYLKLMIDGETSMPFSACSILLKSKGKSSTNVVIKSSRKNYGRML